MCKDVLESSGIESFGDLGEGALGVVLPDSPGDALRV